MAGEGGIGGGFEGGEDGFFLFLDVLLDGFEVSAGDFVGEAEERLVLHGEGGEQLILLRLDLFENLLAVSGFQH